MNGLLSKTAITSEVMARAIDHTVLKPDALRADIDVFAKEAITHGFYALCINPCHVALASKLLNGSDVHVCTVVGFPLGCTTLKAKAFEAETAIKDGASEIDMVLNVGALKSGEIKTVEADIKAVRQIVSLDRQLKVIIETCLLTNNEKILACKIAETAGANFVKTSTGFSSGGATVEDVRLMKQIVGDRMQVKASGGIRDWDQATAMIQAGASRIGTSSGVTILQNEP
jgi:deoxyribose-phosphate aldolase